jgi:hypothetical protein
MRLTVALDLLHMSRIRANIHPSTCCHLLLLQVTDSGDGLDATFIARTGCVPVPLAADEEGVKNVGGSSCLTPC